MKGLRLQEYKNFKENLIKDVRNLFRMKKTKKETNNPAVKGRRNLFCIKIKNKAIKERIIRDVRNLFGHNEEDYYKPVQVGNFWSNNYIKNKIKGDRKTVSVKKYLNKVGA